MCLNIATIFQLFIMFHLLILLKHASFNAAALETWFLFIYRHATQKLTLTVSQSRCRPVGRIAFVGLATVATTLAGCGVLRRR